jgi:hypothetical protein
VVFALVIALGIGISDAGAAHQLPDRMGEIVGPARGSDANEPDY